jgi:plastocyanin
VLRRFHSALFAAAYLPASAPTAAAQSLLDRPPNLSGDWVANPGTMQFNFLHRFVQSGAPERKVTNFPTFLVAVGLPRRTTLGFHYATNSTLTPRYPNEWEFFGRYAPFSQDAGSPLDLAGQVGYNIAAEGVDGEVSLARRLGPVRLIAVTRILSNPYESGKTRLALGGGAAVRLGRYLALAGDVASLTNRDSARGEKVAWSAGLHVAIPSSPHTLSFQVTNTNTATLQGLSRGGRDRRYGFEFTIPITLARYFGRRQPPAPVSAEPANPEAGPLVGAPPAPEAPPADSAAAAAPARAARKGVKASIRNLAFAPGKLKIATGATVTWRNGDPLTHTITATDHSFDSGSVEYGRTWSRTFARAGTYTYSCSLHPFMKGTIVVKAAP